MSYEDKILALLTEIATNLEHFRQETNERLDQIEEKVDKCNARCRARSSVLNDRLFEQECRLEFLKDELVHSGYLAEYDISLENDGGAEEIL